MQFAYATNSCLNKRVLLGQSVVLIDVPIKDISSSDRRLDWKILTWPPKGSRSRHPQ
jgi:hypothetical protein